MRGISSFSLVRLSLLLISALLLVILPATGCAGSDIETSPAVSTNAPPATVKKLGVANSDKYSVKILQILIKPLNEQGELVSTDGVIDIELWDDMYILSGEKTVIQKWDDVPLTASSFQQDKGHLLVLEYKYFEPEPGTNAVIHLAFTADDVMLDAEEVITLFPMACCYD